MYLYGGYEEPQIRSFVNELSRRRVILDVGANVGTHSLAFAQAFDTVHSFEPNSSVWSKFERNLDLNGFENVQLHKVGLGDQSGHFPFYNINNDNDGLGTFLEFQSNTTRLYNCLEKRRLRRATNLSNLQVFSV